MSRIDNPVKSLINNLIITFLFTLLGLFIGSLLPYSVIRMLRNAFTILILVSFIMALFFRRPLGGGRRRGLPMGGVYFYGLFLGITLYPSILYYFNVLGLSTVFGALIGTILFMSLIALFTVKKGTDSIFKLGPILFALTFGIFIISLLQMFFGFFEGASLVMIIASMIIFSLWTVYDIYRFKKSSNYIQTSNDLAPFVLDIYIDFINLFMDLLRLMARFKDE